ncbi:MAG: hypothetical protein ABJE47_05485 [bacterium]
MLNLDITKANEGIDKLLAITTNPRHRYILMAYSRHRYLEFSGRYDEVLADDMMVENPVYNLHALGFNTQINGKEEVRKLYRYWAETNQCIFYGENEQVAVADNFVASTVTAYQQVWGASITASKVMGFLPKGLSKELLLKLMDFHGLKPDPDSMYLYKNFEETIWPYDDRCRLMREDVIEPDPSKAEIIKLAPADVMTTAQAAKLLAPFVKPLPNFDEYVLGKKPS